MALAVIPTDPISSTASQAQALRGHPGEGGRQGSCMAGSEMLHCANVGQQGQNVGSALYQE